MPIVNCIIAPNCPEGSGDLIEFWSTESGHSSEHMTINVIESSRQMGKEYLVMATLSLPSMWSDSDVSSLQMGLSKAIGSFFSIANEQIHIVTHVINSGMVVEAGKEITWS